MPDPHAGGTPADRRRQAERVAETVLYEGYILYPYRASSAKNRSRWTFGTLFPAGVPGEPQQQRLQCLLRAPEPPQVEVRVRFLQVLQRGGWQEAREHEFGPGRFAVEAGQDGEREWTQLEGTVAVFCEPVTDQAWRLTVCTRNDSPLPPGATREQAQRSALASTHVLLQAQGDARFVSLIDPPPGLQGAAAACHCDGTWPVLIGAETESDTLLASPIILYDDPQLAPESPGLLYDAGEIDEILSLRVLTLTDAEKREAVALDPRARAVIEQTGALTPAQWESLHGCFRPVAGVRPGDRVRLRPRRRSDIMDMALAGRIAIVQGVERDYEQRVHVAVALEDDPGRDLGLARWPGHRFFFNPDELEILR